MTNKENHYRLWTYLHENPEKEKEDWPEWEFNGGKVPEAEFMCFACEEAGGEDDRDCGKCSIKWSGEEPSRENGKQCVNNDTVYDKWEDYNKLGITFKERSSLALQIRDMWK